jgi:predicted nuclease of restriction endonuclease-like (RecB) superfamily
MPQKLRGTAKPVASKKNPALKGYRTVLEGVVELLEHVRRATARTINSVMTATYWEIGHRIIEYEQGGKHRAKYGELLLERLSNDLIVRFGRGFSLRNLRNFRTFYLVWPIRQTVSAESGISNFENIERIRQTASAEIPRFPLPWSHYVRLIAVENSEARRFYEGEAIRAGWSVRQLDRQISSLFYERIALSRKKASMIKKGSRPKPEDRVTPEEEIKDPLILEFLGMKDEYSESDLEESLINHLQAFLMELGDDFAFIGRQRRLRIGDEWYRIDMLFYHRRLRSLIVIDLKLGKFSHTDAGQMHMYLNYAREHWTREGENQPVGLILCAQKNDALARYALDNLPNKVLAAEYRLALPDEKMLAKEIERTQKIIAERGRQCTLQVKK